MARITKDLRETMLKALLDHGFKAAAAEARAKMHAIGDKVYADVYSEYLPAMNKLPDSFFQKRKEFKVICGGQYFKVEFTESKPMPERDDIYRSGAVAKIYDAGHALLVEYETAFQAVRDVERARHAASLQANAVLESVTTFKKLWEVWPDCRPILECYDQENKAYPVSIPVQSLNAAFGLPVDEVAA